MRDLAYIFILVILSVNVANAQSENKSILQQPGIQNTYLAKAESPLKNASNANETNPAALRRSVVCDKIAANTEFTPTGIIINPIFELKNAAQRKLRITAYFYYAEDTPMPAAHRGYSTSNYQLATWKDLELDGDDVRINHNAPYDLMLLMPYNKMGLNRDLLNLKYFLALFDGNEKIQESDWIFFKIAYSKPLFEQP
ncbi:MAG: hypothetical protein JWQ25_453 [Daejeonella sp.]|nr:hypothetical protein [Daejeonella sp.]